MKKHITISILIIFFSGVCFGQSAISLKGKIAKETRYYPDSPQSLQEKIFEYYEGKLYRISNYSNSLLTGYEEIFYDDYGNEEKRVYFRNNDEVMFSLLSFYDTNGALRKKYKLDEHSKVVILYEYDEMGRIIFENHPKDEINPEEACRYYQFEYSHENLIKKSFYNNCDLKGYEIYFYDNTNKLTKVEFYTSNELSKYILYEYQDNMLVAERLCNTSVRNNYRIEKRFIYDNNGFLIETMENGKTIEKNYYRDGLLIMSENYNYEMMPRPPKRSGLSIIEYDYY